MGEVVTTKFMFTVTTYPNGEVYISKPFKLGVTKGEKKTKQKKVYDNETEVGEEVFL